jgi:hypothetical protein
MAVFSGNAHPKLAHDIARCLHVPLARAHVGRFSDGEINVEILENIRGRETFIVQPTCPPTSENLMELLVMVDAARRASAERITAVIPYFGFARQDRRPRSARVPITAKLVAKLIGAAGVDRVLTVDLHADQIQGFFDIAVDNVYASPLLLGDVWKQKITDMVVVSPDVGGVVRARALAKRLDDADLVIIDKRRAKVNQSDCVMGVLPFFHSFGFTGTLWFPLLSGFAAAYHPNPLDAKTVGEMVSKHGATMLISTPTFCTAYLRKCSKEEFSSLRLALVGAEKLRAQLAEAFLEKYGLPLVEGIRAAWSAASAL